MRNDISGEKHAHHQAKTSDQAGCDGDEKRGSDRNREQNAQKSPNFTNRTSCILPFGQSGFSAERTIPSDEVRISILRIGLASSSYREGRQLCFDTT